MPLIRVTWHVCFSVRASCVCVCVCFVCLRDVILCQIYVREFRSWYVCERSCESTLCAAELDSVVGERVQQPLRTNVQRIIADTNTHRGTHHNTHTHHARHMHSTAQHSTRHDMTSTAQDKSMAWQHTSNTTTLSYLKSKD